MNSHMQGGPPIPQPLPMQPHSRRHQEYHQYQQQPAPHSPGPHNPYAGYAHPQQYYGHPTHMPYGLPRWQSHQGYPQYPMPPPQHYPPRSPLVVSSQPHSQTMTTSIRPPLPSYPYPPQPTQSPRPAPPTPSASVPPSLPSPREPSSHSSSPHTSRRPSAAIQPIASVRRMPYYPDLPWYSTSDGKTSFPPRASRRRRRRQNLHVANDAVALPSRTIAEEIADEDNVGEPSETSTVAAPSERETPATSQAPSEGETPASASSAFSEGPVATFESPTPNTHARRDTRTAVPIIPGLSKAAKAKQQTPPLAQPPSLPPPATAEEVQSSEAASHSAADAEASQVRMDDVVTPPPKAAPKSWADLVRSKNASVAAANAIDGSSLTNGAVPSRAGSLRDVLSEFSVDNEGKIAFIEPRGLVNMGNMCYMNSILQVLVFCIPFYNFLDQVGKRAAHSFKSDTPLVDAMIMFMQEYKIIDSADSVEKLRMRLKDGELEEYGEPFIPEYVYDVIKRLPRFSSMRRGHQQDAEEFLGFLLAGLHDECVSVMRTQTASDAMNGDALQSPEDPSSPTSGEAGWQEVGPKQKAAITRQSGDSTTPSPMTRIFGGALRSELRVPGLKNSVTLEPYQPLQLDIGAANVNNITDALRGLTRPESLTGDFNSPRGPGTTATKQVFIETLPSVLILHLKRFQYDSSGGTQKIWKRVGYPLELEIPKEVFSPTKRGGLAVKGGLPTYRLIGVVYHHGKSAAGGHYTVDILRQDRREWIRVDDTIIRRIRADDVAEGGAEEDPKVLARALEAHKADQESAKRNLFEGLDGDDDKSESTKSWSEVNGVEGKKKWAGIAAGAGTATPSTAGKRTPMKEGVKDNKVAYILLYEKIKG